MELEKGAGAKLGGDVHVALGFAKEKKKEGNLPAKAGLWVRAPGHMGMAAGGRHIPQLWINGMLLSLGTMGYSSALNPWNTPQPWTNKMLLSFGSIGCSSVLDPWDSPQPWPMGCSSILDPWDSPQPWINRMFLNLGSMEYSSALYQEDDHQPWTYGMLLNFGPIG